MNDEAMVVAQAGLEAATVMRFRGGRVVSMQDYRTEQEATDAAASLNP